MRELANAIERALILSRGSVLQPSAFQEQLRDGMPRAGRAAGGSARSPEACAGGVAAGGARLRRLLPFDLEEIERRAIVRALEATGGNRTRAAKLLGISERTLRNKLNSPKAGASARRRSS